MIFLEQDSTQASSPTSAQATAYRRLVARRLAVLTGLTVMLALSVAVDVSLGPARYSLCVTGSCCQIRDTEQS